MNPESNEALSRRAAEAAGWTIELQTLCRTDLLHFAYVAYSCECVLPEMGYHEENERE